MSVHFNAHPVTPDLGLRESINALLNHVAYARRDFGYLPDTVNAANHECLLDYYSDIISDNDGVLTLRPLITDSALLDDMVNALIGAANDHPSLDDEIVSRIEHERILEAADESLRDAVQDFELGRIPSAPDERVTPEGLACALYETSAYIEQSVYGAAWGDSDMSAALAYAIADLNRREAEANGLLPMF